MRTFEVGGATVTLGDPSVAELPDYLITDAHIDYTKHGSVTSANLTVSISFPLTGNAYGKVARFRVTDKNNKTAIMKVRAMPTLYPIATNLGQLVPEIVKTYSTTVSEADPTFTSLARHTPSTAGNFVPLGTVGVPNVTAPVTMGQVAQAGNGTQVASWSSSTGGASARRLLSLTVNGKCCSSSDLTAAEVNLCFGTHRRVAVEPMPYSIRGTINRGMSDFCLDDDAAGAKWDADVQLTKTWSQFAEIDGDNRRACGKAIYDYTKNDPTLGALLQFSVDSELKNEIRRMLMSANYSQFQIARGQPQLTCVMAEPDRRGAVTFPADTTGISCTPDFDRKLQSPNPAMDGVEVPGFYETIGTPCPCAPQTDRYYRSCTLNPFDSTGRPFPAKNLGVVQKCAYIPFTARDQILVDAKNLAAGNGSAPQATQAITGQGFCMPYTFQKSSDPTNLWVDNIRDDLATSVGFSWRDCDGVSVAANIGRNAGVAAGFALAAGATGGLSIAAYALASTFGGGWGNWPFKTKCPEYTSHIDDNSYRGNEIGETANAATQQAVSLLSLIGDQTNALDMAQNVALRAADALRASANVSRATLEVVNNMYEFENATLFNMRLLNATASDLTARIQSSQTEVTAALTAVDKRINATYEQMRAFQAGLPGFYSAANRSLAVQQQLIEDQRTQFNYLLSVEKRNRQAIQDLTAAFSRYTQGRDQFRRAIKSLHTTLDYALLIDGLFPFTTRRPDGTGSVQMRLPLPEESNIVVDRSWTYFGTASRPPRYNRTTASMSTAGAAAYNSASTIWLARQQYELRCALGYLSALTRVNLTTETFKTMLGVDGCDPYASYGRFDPVTNQTSAGASNACNCVVQVTESVCATVHASPDAFLSTIHDPLRNAYAEPLGSTVVGTTGFDEAHACVPTTETTLPTRTFRASTELDAFVTDTCVSRENVSMIFNAQWGPIAYVTQENGQRTFNVPDWTTARNATSALVEPTISLTDYASSMFNGGGTSPGGSSAGMVSTSIWDLAMITNRSRTAHDWCTTVPRETLVQTAFTQLQLFPQRIYSYWPYTLMRFMGSPFLKEIDLALNGRGPIFGVNQVFRAYDNQPHPGDVTATTAAGTTDKPSDVITFPASTLTNRTEYDAYLASLTDSMKGYDRPVHCLEHNFVATGASMMPVFYPRLRTPVRCVRAEFINSNGIVGAGGGGGGSSTTTVNISQADVDFFNAQLVNRTVLESKSQSATSGASDGLALLRGMETMVGYLSCKYDDAPCAYPRRYTAANSTGAADDDSYGWYTYSADPTQLAAFARILAQRHGTMNYIRTRVPVRANAADTPSIHDLGWNATNRRPMISAQTFLFEEVVQAVDPETYALLAAQLLRTSQEQPPRVNWDLLRLTDPQLQTLMHSVLLSPTHRYDPMEAGFNPDAQRLPLIDVTDRSYETDPDAVGVQCVTAAGHPNVISRRSMRPTGAQSDEEKFHESWNIVRDPSPWSGGSGGGSGAPTDEFSEAGRDPDNADTWKTLWVVPTTEVVSVTIVIGQAQIDQLFQVATSCPRNTAMHQATTSNPIIAMVRPGPDQAVTLRFNVTTVSRNQSCDGIRTVHLPAVDIARQQSVFDMLYVNFTSAATAASSGGNTGVGDCPGIRSVVMDRIGLLDETTGLTVEQHCWSWKMGGNDAFLPAGEQMLFQAQSTVDTDASFVLQKIAQNMVTLVDEVADTTLAMLKSQLSVMEYAYANGVNISSAVSAIGGGGGSTPTGIDLTDVLARLGTSINATVFNAPITTVDDPDAIIAQLRDVVNRTELERIMGDPNATLSSFTNLYALTQAMMREEAELQLLNNDTYYASVTAPLMDIQNIMTSADYRRNLAITANWIDNSTQVDWACMARLEDARFYDLSLDTTFPQRIRALRDAVERQDASCEPGFHNFWQFGHTNSPQSNGPLAPDTTHYTGPFCSQAGDVGLEIIWTIVMLALVLWAYEGARRTLISMGTPGSRLYSASVANAEWFQDWKARSKRQRAFYKAYMEGPDGEGATALSDPRGEMEMTKLVGRGKAGPARVRPLEEDVAKMDAAPAAGHGLDKRRVVGNLFGGGKGGHWTQL